MRRTVLSGSLFLAVALVAMSGTVLAQQGNRAQTASHEISGELLGSINFVERSFFSKGETDKGRSSGRPSLLCAAIGRPRVGLPASRSRERLFYRL
jgi:hypothetical protein